ncbi:MAG: hypothetical protein SGJ11_04450 [Phycisphaerae bacterium]|nr:hypothetical protein [Phycisphaerae bacterium]
MDTSSELPLSDADPTGHAAASGAPCVRLALDIFIEACELPVEQRAAHVTFRCEGNAALRREIERMLLEDDPAYAAHQATAHTDPAAGHHPHSHRGHAPARRVTHRLDRAPVLQGRYRVLRTIGEGGMGNGVRGGAGDAPPACGAEGTPRRQP